MTIMNKFTFIFLSQFLIISINVFGQSKNDSLALEYAKQFYQYNKEHAIQSVKFDSLIIDTLVPFPYQSINRNDSLFYPTLINSGLSFDDFKSDSNNDRCKSIIDSRGSILIAMRILNKKYGFDKVMNERPYKAILLDNKIWIILGYKTSEFGSRVKVSIDLFSGELIKIWQEK